ncbi:MAG TPA: DNA mismatch repair protein MutT, partial [Ruminococcaceae bacterium]|nr:DNA mismatch repair protein MutT [Oscillospiraceae bacterium]
MELWDIYDENEKKTERTMRRVDWQMKPGEYHLTVLGVLQKTDGRYLITKRKADKEWAPGKWEVSGGGVLAGETSLQAVIREVGEETGIAVTNARGGYVFSYKREKSKEKNNYFLDIYKFVLDFDLSDVKIQEEEVAACRLASKEEIEALAKQGEFLHYD